ncbi:MAG: deaminase [Anaerolineaceae bacterium]|nr:deaminase [Anaerolineaceae bacterium]
MRKLIYSCMVSLDGFVARPNGDLDWVVVDEELHTFINNQQQEIDLCFYGRGMYEVLRYWETADQDPTLPAFELEFAKIWQKTPKIVFSTTLEEVQGNTRLVQGDAVAEVRRQKQQAGKDMEVGGPTLATTFIQQNMIDVYGLFVQPVLLGEGVPFFPSLARSLSLRLVQTRPFQSGVVYLRYELKEQ